MLAWLVLYGLWSLGRTQDTKARAFELALKLSQPKGLLNVGACGVKVPWMSLIYSASARVNLDIEACPLPGFVAGDLNERLPFRDGEFSVAWASHVIEHLDRPDYALSELSRVADRVIVVLPHPLAFANWTTPEHKQHFSWADMRDM